MSDNEDLISNYRKTVEATAIYQAGKILDNARHSLKNAILTPILLYRLAKRHRELERTDFKNITHKITTPELHTFDISNYALSLLAKYANNFSELAKEAKENSKNSKKYNQVIAEVARIVAYSDAAAAARILRNADKIDKHPTLLKKLGFLLYQSGDLINSSAILSTDTIYQDLTNQDKAQARKIISEASILQHGIKIPIRHKPAQHDSLKTMYVCHTSFPHHTNGYAVRTHNIAKALINQGVDIHCVSRPGYPWDRKDALHSDDIESKHNIDGVTYYRYRTTNVTELPFIEYVEHASQTLLQHIQQYNVSVVMAASNYINALPALIAARKAGVPFIYDIRGLWEYTFASQTKNWEYTERFQLYRRMETLVARESDRIIAISTALKGELISRGVQPGKISIALNATNIIEQKNENKTREEIREELNIPNKAVTIGYIGSIEKYEGLQNLMAAAKMLIEEGIEIFLLIVGSGSYTSTLHDQCCFLGIINNVRFTGRVPYKKAQSYYAAIDICVYPRLPDKVCNIIPPLKPLEAMAHRKPVITSELAPIIELLGKDNALFMKKNCTANIYDLLKELLNSESTASQLAIKGYTLVSHDRNWNKTAETYLTAAKFPKISQH